MQPVLIKVIGVEQHQVVACCLLPEEGGLLVGSFREAAVSGNRLPVEDHSASLEVLSTGIHCGIHLSVHCVLYLEHTWVVVAMSAHQLTFNTEHIYLPCSQEVKLMTRG